VRVGVGSGVERQGRPLGPGLVGTLADGGRQVVQSRAAPAPVARAAAGRDAAILSDDRGGCPGAVPPAVDSPAFRAAVAEVRVISADRTSEQLRIAQYRENLTGAFASGLWNQVARGAISSRGLSEAEAARVLAPLHITGVDATIACHDSKYAY
jgi:hypothetical protein